MHSLRRDCLDKLLEDNKEYFRGKILDLGGKKEGKRGNFDISKYSSEVTYLNTDNSTCPDINSSAENIPIEDNTFDCVVATELLEYISDPKVVMEEVYRVMKVDGHAFISVPLLHPIHGDYNHDKLRFTESYLQALSNEIGFKEYKIQSMGSVGSVLFDILKISFGYAGNSSLRGVFSYILFIFKPFFRLLDKMTENQKRFINTGYFLVLKK